MYRSNVQKKTCTGCVSTRVTVKEATKSYKKLLVRNTTFFNVIASEISVALNIGGLALFSLPHSLSILFYFIKVGIQVFMAKCVMLP